MASPQVLGMGGVGLHKADIALFLCKEDLGGEVLSGRAERGCYAI